MKQIFKYPIPISGSFPLDLPEGAEILCVQVQNGVGPCIWALVDSDNASEVRDFSVVGTGRSTNVSIAGYIGTFQELNGQLIWHLFEI